MASARGPGAERPRGVGLGRLAPSIADEAPAGNKKEQIRACTASALRSVAPGCPCARGSVERMGEPAPKPYVSFAEYEALEERSLTKHEWLDGAIHDMSGGSPEHAGLAMAVGRLLGNQLAGKRCRVFSSDLKVRVKATGLSTYPDVSVVCGHLERDPESATAVTNPTVLVEVLSDASEGYDRGEKFAHYRRIPSLCEYVLVGQRKRRIEVFRKNVAGLWVLVAEAGEGERATLESIGCTLAVDEVYTDPLAEPA